MGRTSPSNVFGNSSYTFHKESPQYHNWKESRDLCRNIGSDLVSIESKKEWFFLKETIQKYATGEYFIGLKKDGKSKEWQWISDNSKVNATRGKFPWAKDNPSGDGNCAVMYKDYREEYGLFDDLNCVIKQNIAGYICESSVNSNDQEIPAVKPTSYRTESKRKGSVRKTTTRRSLAATSAARLTTSNSPSTEAPSKDNCQGVCMIHTPVRTTKTATIMTTATTISSGTSPGDERCSCYTFENDRLVSWPLAMASCKQINKDLVVIETQREWKFITMKIQTRKSGKHDEWHIGLYKSSLTGNWTWINGKALTIDKWQKNAPNDNNSYTLMAKEWPTGFKGSFKTITESTTRGWICEEVTDNCQGVCLSDTLDDTSATSLLALASSTESTASHATRDSEEGKQAYEKDNCSLSVTILASLVLIFGVCFLSWRKKTTKRNELDNQDESLLSAETAARQLGFSDEAKPHGIEYRRRETVQDSRQECEYAMLTPRTMMVPGDSSYASLVKSKQGDCTKTSSVAASPLPQQDAEPHDELPTYINVHSLEHI